MPKAKTAVPAPVVLGFAELNEQAAAVLEALNRVDLEHADRLRATYVVLANNLDADEAAGWRWKSGLADFVDVMAAIRKLAGSCLAVDDDPTCGACTNKQVAELVEMVREKAAKRRAKALSSAG